MSNGQLYDELDKIGFFKTPTSNEVSNPENRPTKVIDLTIDQYKAVRKALYLLHGSRDIGMDGKISDQVVTAILIAREFGGFKTTDLDVYGEALEAVSNQYYSDATPPGNMLCYGNCTINTQISWFTDVEAFRATDLVDVYVKSGVYETYMGDAGDAIGPGGYTHGSVDSSWNFGNVGSDYNDLYYVTAYTDKSYYPGYPYFIVYSGKK